MTVRQWFQSTPPRGGRQGRAAFHFRRHQGGFNPRPRAGGDDGLARCAAEPGGFQSTPPRGGRRLFQKIWDGHDKFQSTPPRGGRQRRRQRHGRHNQFQSTPPRGGRLGFTQTMASIVGFNPRPRAGGDDVRGLARCLPVSIHAPARGATVLPRKPIKTCRFQSTPPRGGRRSYPASARPGCGFNPRPRAGGDRSASAKPQAMTSFNPRPRAGGDLAGDDVFQSQRVSIHAPARGATKDAGGDGGDSGFQSTPPRGGRLSGHVPGGRVHGFQSTPPRGGRPLSRYKNAASRSFQSTPPRGGRPSMPGQNGDAGKKIKNINEWPIMDLSYRSGSAISCDALSPGS